MDEEDEEPFSAKAEYVVPKAPKQDVLPKRPNPGGRFPSDLEVSTARGLQVPLSPQTSSESSGVEDRRLTATAGNIPGSGVGHGSGHGYGGYGQDNSPTHGALVNKYAEEDGVNPYTSKPVTHDNIRSQGVSDEVLAGGAAIGGAVLGAAGYQAYRNREDGGAAIREEQVQPGYDGISSPDQRHELERLAAYEATMITAPDTGLSAPLDQRHESEKLAVYEATLTPDIGRSASSSDYFMAGGISQGNLADTENVDLGNSQSQNPAEVILDPLAEDLARNQPSIAAGQNHQSITSISQLHIPGEFPRTYSYSA